GAYAISEVVKLFGYALMHKLYGYDKGFSVPISFQAVDGPCWNSYISIFGKANTAEAKSWAFKSGFGRALSLFSFDSSKYCLLGEPDRNKDTCRSYYDLEESTSISEPFSPYQEGVKKWVRHTCDTSLASFLRNAYSWELPGYVASAIWDLYDDVSETDWNKREGCEWRGINKGYVDQNGRPCNICINHEVEGRYPCDELKISWSESLTTLYVYKPKDYVDFAYKLWQHEDVSEDVRKRIDRVSKFNGIEFLPQMPRQVEIEPKKRVTPDSLEKRIFVSWYDCSGVETGFLIRSDIPISLPSFSLANNQETFRTLDVSCILNSYEDVIYSWRFGRPHCYQVAAVNNFNGSRLSPKEAPGLCPPNKSPIANLKVSRISSNVIILDASGSYDDDGVIWIYKWDCGYYVPDEVLNQIRDQVRNLFGREIEIGREGNYLITPYGINRMVCIYPTGGNYGVSVIVIDDEGDAGYASEVVSISAPSQPIPEQPPSPQPPPPEEGIGCYSVPPIYSAILLVYVVIYFGFIVKLINKKRKVE
ncbi:MAG: hypothetical protein RRA63_04500, partial [Candidatus Calescibacterium sp.]|nr:hypothetical protein [Candidatus Calescibacterium sp.]